MSVIYRYTIPADTGFRSYTVSEGVDNLDPDGFAAPQSIGDGICEQVLIKAGLTSALQWDAYGTDGAQRLLFWRSEEDAANDAGLNAAGQIIKRPV